MEEIARRRRDLRAMLPLLAVTLVAAALRLPGISARALWIDEAFCVRIAQGDWHQIIERSAADNHPPLFFGLLKLWMAVFGTSPLALRTLTLLLGVATVALVYLLARRVVGGASQRSATAAATIAAAWLALQPVHVLWSAQVRMYALAGFLAALSALLLLRVLERPASWSRWAAWTLAATALVYTHYFGAFVVLAQGLHVLVVIVRSPERRTALVRMIAAGLAVCAFVAPWFGVVWSQSARVAALWWVPPLTPGRLLWGWSRTAGFWIEDEFTAPSGVHAVAVAAVALLVAALVIAAAIRRDRPLRLVAWCALGPILGGLAATLAVGNNVMLARYSIVAEVFIPIAVVGVLGPRLTRRAGLLVLAPIATALVVALVSELPILSPAPDLPAAMAWVDEHREPGDLVVVHQFYYWSVRIGVPDGDPQLRMFARNGEPLQFLGSALIDHEDSVLGPADMERIHGHLIVVDGAYMHVKIPPGYRKLASARYAVWMPPDPKFWIDVTRYEAP